MRFKLTVLFVVLAATISACGLFEFSEPALPQNNLTPGSEVSLTGVVVDTIDTCAADGICAYVLDTAIGEIDAIWAEGMMRCEGTLAEDISIGEEVQVFGLVQDDTSQVSICAMNDHYIIRSGEPTPIPD